MRAEQGVAHNTSRPVRSLAIWSTFLSHSLARASRHVVSGQSESVEDELHRVEQEFQHACSMRHARRRVAEALGLEQ